MPRLPNTANLVERNRRRNLRAFFCGSVVLSALFFAGEHAATCQIASGSASGQTEGPSGTGESASASVLSPDDGNVSENDRTSATNLGGQTQTVALPSDQIITILDQNPDLLDELKSQLADLMAQQGMQIDSNDISDQALYNQIATDPKLRAYITTVLRARGLVPDDDLRSFGSSGTGDDALESLNVDQVPFSPADGLARMDAGAGGRIGQGTGSFAGDTSAGTLPLSSQPGLSRRTSIANPRAHENASASTDLPVVVHQPVPMNLQSMRDLYAQIPNETAHLVRFGSDVFVNRALSDDEPRNFGAGYSARRATRSGLRHRRRR